MKLLAPICVAIATALAAQQALAQTQPTPPVGPDFSKIEVKTHELGKNTYMLEGAGGNVTIAVGKDGIIMVDGQFAPMHDKLVAAIKAKSPLPVKYLINTHYHGDHTGGNEGFAKDGIAIVAHVNVKNRLAAGTTHNITGAKTPPRPDALPKFTYTDKSLAKVKGRKAELTHPVGAHTDGDTFVYFRDVKVLATGDTFTSDRYPNIDFTNGGNIRGMIRASDQYLRIAGRKTKIVPGHGPLADRAKLQEFRAMLLTSADRIDKLIREGKSEEDVQALKPFANDLDKKWAPNEQAAKNWVRVVYRSLKP
jgi:glyoxylase-like metal-dependent hydrolase (beta-lactamase superfamily II)